MNTKTILLAGFSILFFNISTAQERWEVQFRPGLNFTTEDFAGANIKTGFGFEVAGAYKITRSLGVYAGGGWNDFRTNESLANSEFNVEETGYSLGLHYNFPLVNSLFAPFIQAGAIYNHFELKSLNGDISADSGYGPGWQVGAGVESGIGGNFFLRPSIRYRSLSRNLEIVDGHYEASLRYISVGVALLKKF